MAVSTEHIFYSVEIRMYALVILLTLFSIYAYMRLIESNKTRWWLAHIITTGLIIWTHILGIIILPRLAIHAYCFGFNQWRKKIAWTLLQRLAILTIIPWLLSIDIDIIANEYNRRILPTLFTHKTMPPTPSVQHVLALWTTAPTYQRLGPTGTHLLTAFNAVTVVMYAISLLFMIRSMFKRITEPDGTSTLGLSALIFSILVVPIALLYTISYVWEPSFFDRYILISMIALNACLAVSILSIPNKSLRTSLILILLGCTTFQAASQIVVPVRKPWSKVIELIDNEENPNIRISILGQGGDMPMALAEAKYHLGERENTILTFYSFSDLDQYFLSGYNQRTQWYRYPMDIILLMDKDAHVKLIQNMRKYQIEYSIEYTLSRQYLSYVRLHPPMKQSTPAGQPNLHPRPRIRQ